jgi:hypothetical protein
MSNDKQFYEKVDKMFEDKLFYEEISVIRVKDLKADKILENLDYENLLRFDANLNMYKLHTDGTWILVNNENFKPIIVKKEVHKKTSS